MFYKKFLLPITGSFITGFGSAYLIFKKDFKLNEINLKTAETLRKLKQKLNLNKEYLN